MASFRSILILGFNQLGCHCHQMQLKSLYMSMQSNIMVSCGAASLEQKLS